jgi:quinol monooxygenase YgiN
VFSIGGNIHALNSWSEAELALAGVGLQEASVMYGLIVKLTVVTGKREEMVAILKESAAGMPGCFSYVVARDSTEENAIWVTEVWDSVSSHDASLSSPSVKNAIPRAKEIVISFNKIAATSPVWGVGLPTESTDPSTSK